MQQETMNLKILLPFKVFAQITSVSRIVLETHIGSLGILPHRLDCIAALVPGLLTYETETNGEVYVALDEGVLVKTGLDVSISVRNAIAGKDLAELRVAVEDEFVTLNEQEQLVRLAMSKIESNFINRHQDLQDE